MDPYESLYERKLMAKVTEARELKVNAILSGHLDPTELQQAIAYIHALGRIQEWSLQARKEVYGTGDSTDDE